MSFSPALRDHRQSCKGVQDSVAARKLLKEDISAEVVDLRSVVPLDIEAIIGSTRRQVGC